MLSVIGIFKLFLTNKYFFKYIKRFVFKKTKGPKKEENLSFNYIIKKQKIPQNQNYSQKKKYKRTNNDLQNNTNKAKNRVIDMKRKFKH
jgi:hypothetical protein